MCAKRDSGYFVVIQAISRFTALETTCQDALQRVIVRRSLSCNGGKSMRDSGFVNEGFDHFDNLLLLPTRKS